MESHVRKGGFFSEDNVDSDFSSISPTSSPIGTLPFLRLCIHSHYDSEIYNLKILHDLLLSDLSDNHSSLHTIIKPFLDEWLSSVDIVGLCLERLVSGWLKSSFNFSSSSSSSSGSTRDIQKLMEVYQSTKTNPSPNANSSNIYEIQKFNSHTHAQTITQSLHITTNLLSLLTLLLYTRVTPDRSTLLAIVNSLKRVNFFGDHPALSTTSSNSNSNSAFMEGTVNFSMLKKLPMIASLLVTEAFSFWRIVPPEVNNDGRSNGVLKSVQSHPLLSGVFDGGNVTRVLEELGCVHDVIINECVPDLLRRRSQYSGADDEDFVAPEAILTLSWGLWMRLIKFYLSGTHHTLVTDFLNNRDVAALSAANEFSAFTYLKRVAMTLNTSDVSSNAVAYSSIAKECISATIAGFFLMSEDVDNNNNLSPEDISVLCSLASATHKGQAELCSQFWEQWNDYANDHQNNRITMGDDNNHLLKFDPLSHLLNSAYSLSASALQTINPDIVRGEDLQNCLLCSRPLIELVSNLASDEQTASFAIDALPPNCLEFAVKQCSLSTSNNSSSNSNNNHHTINAIFDALSSIALRGGPQAREQITSILTMNGPRYIYNTASNAPTPSIAASALTALSNLTNHGCIKNWPCTVAKCLSASGGARFLLNSPIEVVTAGVKLFYQLSLHASTTFTENKESEGILYLQTLLDGIERTCDILGAINERWNFECRSDRWNLTSICIKNLNACFNALRPYTASFAHPPDSNSIDTRSKLSPQTITIVCNFRDKMIHRLSTDNKVKQEIAMCASLPISSAIRGTIAIKNELRDTKTQNLAWGAWSKFGSDDAGLDNSPPFKKLEISLGVMGTIDPFESLVVSKLVENCLELFLTWFQEVENMGENSRHLSPISLLTSPPPPPPISLAKFEGGNDFVYSDVDVMGTMGNGGENNTHSILGKMATVEFLGYYVSVASNAFARSLNLPSQLSINVLRWCVRYGVPVIEVLGENYKHFNQLYAIIERGELKVALSFLNLVEDCIKHQPEFACKFLNNENVVEAMITCVQCVGPEEEEEDVDKLTLSARSASCIAFLWEASKSKDGDSGSGSGSSKNGLGDAVEKIRNFSNQSFLKKMADVLMNTRTGTGTSTITNQNAIIHKKKLIATALRVLAIEIHSESKLSPVITEFLEAASKTNKYEVWTEEFMIFSDSTFYELSEGCDVNAVFNKSDLVVPPASFRSGTISGDDNEIFDCELVSEFMRVSRNGNHDLVVGCLMNYNTIWALASAEATLIRSWRRFMEMCVLHNNNSSISNSNNNNNNNKNNNILSSNNKSNDDGYDDNYNANLQTPQFSPKSRRKRSSSGEDYNDPPQIALPSTPASFTTPKQTSSSNFLGDFRSHAMVFTVVKTLARNNNTNSDSSVGAYAFAVVASDMAEALVSMLHHQLHVVVKKTLIPGNTKTIARSNSRLYDASHCLTLLDGLELASNRLFKATEPMSRGGGGPESQQCAHDLAARLRLRLLTAAVLIVGGLDVVGDNDSSNHNDDCCDVKIRMLELVCDTLNLLKCKDAAMDHINDDGNRKAHLVYWFGEEQGIEIGDDGNATTTTAAATTTKDKNVDLLKTCLALITALLPKNTNDKYSGSFVNTLRSYSTFEALQQHLDSASSAAAKEEKGKGGGAGEVGRNYMMSSITSLPLQLVLSIMSFFDSGACSCTDMVIYLGGCGIHQHFTSNVLLRNACVKWEKRGGGAVTRGYRIIEEFENQSLLTSAVVDPVEEVFHLAARTATSMLRFRFSDQGSVECLEQGLDFVTTYKGVILSVLKVGPRNGCKYTVKGLEMMRDCLELLGELCRCNVDRFKLSAGELFGLLESIVKEVVVDLSAFLGSSTASRFLFMRGGEKRPPPQGQGHGQGRGRTMSSQVQHQAIAHSHYVSTSVYAMTDDEKAMLCNDDQSNCGNCGNVFAHTMEGLLSLNLGYGLTLLGGMNKRTSGWVEFTREEASRLGADLLGLIKGGMMVGVREKEGFMVGGGADVRFGVVSGVDVAEGVVDVKYTGGAGGTGGGGEEKVGVGRIACVEDSSERASANFEFGVLGTSAGEFRGGGLCLGHLGLGLRWCMDVVGGGGSGSGSGGGKEVKLLAERICSLLASEIGFYTEAGRYAIGLSGQNGNMHDGMGMEVGINGNGMEATDNDAVQTMIWEIFVCCAGEVKTLIGDDQEFLEYVLGKLLVKEMMAENQRMQDAEVQMRLQQGGGGGHR